MPAIDDKVVIRDGTGVWKPAVVTAIRTADPECFVATWIMNAGAPTITVRKDSAIAWKYRDAPVPA